MFCPLLHLLAGGARAARRSGRHVGCGSASGSSGRGWRRAAGAVLRLLPKLDCWHAAAVLRAGAGSGAVAAAG